MQFREVTELIPGTKYRIASNHCVYEGIYVSTNYLHRFKNVPGYESLEFVNFIPHFHTYYEPIFQRDLIQSAMEHRAVNKLLQQIIGDPTFSWAEPRFRTSYNGVVGVKPLQGRYGTVGSVNL